MSRPKKPEIGARTVAEIMRRDVLTVPPETTVRELARLLAERRIGGAPVVGGGGELVGIVSVTDLVRLAASAGDEPLETLLTGGAVGNDEFAGLWEFLAGDAWGGASADRPDAESTQPRFEYEEYTVGEVMQPSPLTVTPATTLRELAKLLVGARVHRAPVVEDQRVVGMVTSFDVLAVVAAEPG